MKHTKISAAIGVVLGPSHAQEPQRAVGTVKEGVTAVLVDVVVRDRRGQPVRDLTRGGLRDSRGRRAADDRIVHTDPRRGCCRAPARRTPPAAPPAAPSPASRRSRPVPRVTAMVFHGLTREPEARGAGGAGLPRRRRKRCRTTSASSASTSRWRRSCHLPGTASRSARR